MSTHRQSKKCRGAFLRDVRAVSAHQALRAVTGQKKSGFFRFCSVVRQPTRVVLRVILEATGANGRARGSRNIRRRPLISSRPQGVRALPSPGAARELELNPMNQRTQARLAKIRAAPRCGARTRAGLPCQCPAIRGKTRCRLLGGLSPGAPQGAENGNYRDGYWTQDAVEVRRWARELVRECGKRVAK